MIEREIMELLNQPAWPADRRAYGALGLSQAEEYFFAVQAGWFRSSMISRSIIGFGWKREPSHLELSPSKWGALNFQLRSRKKPSRFPRQLKPGCWRLFQRRIVLFQTCLDELAP